jgi:MFS family permease
MTRGLSFTSQAWLCVALLWFVACLNYFDRIMLTTMRDSVVEAIPMTDKQFGLLTSVFLWVYGGLSPFAGFLADRFGKSRVIVGSLFAWSAITWLTGHAKTFDQLLAARALMGISEACYIPAGMALIMDYHRGPTHSRQRRVRRFRNRRARRMARGSARMGFRLQTFWHHRPHLLYRPYFYFARCTTRCRCASDYTGRKGKYDSRD